MNLPKGYRFLKTGEKIEKDTLWLGSASKVWVATKDTGVYNPDFHCRMIRRINEVSTRSVEEFFDPYNPEHCRAYSHLCNKGMWPDGFIPDDVVLPTGCQVTVSAMLVGAWINRIIRLDNVRKNREKMEAEFAAERKARIAAKPKAAEIPALMRDGWHLHSHLGGACQHVWMAKGEMIKNVNGGSLTSLVHKHIVKAGTGGGMAMKTEYVLAETEGDE